MKKFISIVLGLCLICQCLVQLGIIGWYGINKDFIAKNLCIKRDIPKNDCCGKCYLKKQLNKTEQNTGNKNSLSKSENLIAYFILPAKWHFNTHHISIGQKHYTLYNSGLIPTYFSNIFHPPPGFIA